jgi:hypothetical protein
VRKAGVGGLATATAGGQPQVFMLHREIVHASGPGAPGGAENAPTVEQLGSKLIEGVQAEGTRTTMIIPAGEMGNEQPIRIVDEQWRSPELQVIVQSEHNDPRMGKTVYSLKNISRVEPSPELFQVPADYSMKDFPSMHMYKGVTKTQSVVR